MKHPYLIMSCVLALTIFSTLYDGGTSNSQRQRSIAAVETTEDGLCVETDSSFGQGPAPLTKEGICKCHPEVCPKPESEEYVDTETGKSYPVEVVPSN